MNLSKVLFVFSINVHNEHESGKRRERKMEKNYVRTLFVFVDKTMEMIIRRLSGLMN